ncbi:MAG: hypothetical protein IJW55_05125 [Clostridia bacterium]|nr:hypothetical protein [Clostridia bacterium]
MDGKRIILAAHRGDKLKYPENTMPAFEAALALGVDMIETDIHMTRDGELIIMHDRNALRTCGVDRNVDEMSLAEVRELDAGRLFDPLFEGVKIPTVVEFLEWIKDTDLLVNWELKDYPAEVGDAFAFATADRLIALIEQYGMEKRSMINSFSARVLEHIYYGHGHRFPIHGQGICGAPKSKDATETPWEELFDWCCMYADEKGKSPLDFKANFDYCLQYGIIPCVCIADTEENYRKAIDYGCKMFTSNNIYEADRILKKLNYR